MSDDDAPSNAVFSSRQRTCASCSVLRWTRIDRTALTRRSVGCWSARAPEASFATRRSRCCRIPVVAGRLNVWRASDQEVTRVSRGLPSVRSIRPHLRAALPWMAVLTIRWTTASVISSPSMTDAKAGESSARSVTDRARTCDLDPRTFHDLIVARSPLQSALQPKPSRAMEVARLVLSRRSSCSQPPLGPAPTAARAAHLWHS